MWVVGSNPGPQIIPAQACEAPNKGAKAEIARIRRGGLRPTMFLPPSRPVLHWGSTGMLTTDNDNKARLGMSRRIGAEPCRCKLLLIKRLGEAARGSQDLGQGVLFRISDRRRG